MKPNLKKKFILKNEDLYTIAPSITRNYLCL